MECFGTLPPLRKVLLCPYMNQQIIPWNLHTFSAPNGRGLLTFLLSQLNTVYILQFFSDPFQYYHLTYASLFKAIVFFDAFSPTLCVHFSSLPSVPHPPPIPSSWIWSSPRITYVIFNVFFAIHKGLSGTLVIQLATKLCGSLPRSFVQLLGPQSWVLNYFYWST